MSKTPALNGMTCTDCEACLDLCPSVFKRNTETGHIEVQDLDQYPEDEIQEVINCCPKDCITWEED